jgi:CheY-like chemotaxis protein
MGIFQGPVPVILLESLEVIMRALIVDDSRFVRGLLRGLLEERGIECE